MKTRHLVFCFLLTATLSHGAPAEAPPNFEQVYQLLRTNLQDVTLPELDRAAVKGLLQQFPDQVKLVTDAAGKTTPATAGGTVTRVALYDDCYAYLRIGSVEGHLAQNLRAAYQGLAETNKAKIKGVILDLRFAGGDDYAVAAAAADCFVNSDRPLLEWGAGSARASAKTNAIALPVAILVNSQTTGAAEALAAALREADVALILGSTTAGQANIFKDFPLGNGEKLRVATSSIKLGDGTVLNHGVKPDIQVDASLADERATMENPYKVLHLVAQDNGAVTNASQQSEEDRPTNEAELVREHRRGVEADANDEGDALNDTTVQEQPAPPTMTDAALAHALDLLKGIAVLQESHLAE